MTPSDLVTASRSLYNAASDTFFSDTQIYNWIWEAQYQLVKKAWVIEAISSSSTVASTQSYAYPTNAVAVRRVAVNGKKLKRITNRDDDAITLSNQNITSTGYPIYYTDWNNTIYMRPIPDGVYTINWLTYNAPSIPSSTGTIDVPLIYHMDLVDFVLMRMFEQDKDFPSAMAQKGIWDGHVADAIAHQRRLKRTDSFKTVQSEDSLPVTILGEA